MNKIEQLWNRVELAAKKLEMCVEDLLLILEGKHPTHKIKQILAPVPENPTPETAPVAAAPQTPAPTPSSTVEPAADTTNTSENPTTSGPADASAAGQESPADSIAESSPAVES